MGWWWGVYALGSGNGSGAGTTWVVAGPCALTLLFVGISVKLLEDRQVCVAAVPAVPHCGSPLRFHGTPPRTRQTTPCPFLIWQLKSKGAAYAAYKQRVPTPLLLLPPSLNRRIGAWLHGGAAKATAAAPPMS